MYARAASIGSLREVTKLEKRFTRPEIETIMKDAGLSKISFRDGTPYWVALGFKN